MLTYLGITPTSMKEEWVFWDVADLGLNQWVLIERKFSDASHTYLYEARGIFRFGKWERPIGPAVWHTTEGQINRDARYIWRAPNISNNPNPEPVPPQIYGPNPAPWTIPDGVTSIHYTGPMDAVSRGGADGNVPGPAAGVDSWNVLDGSPTRWSTVSVSFRMKLELTDDPEVTEASPMYGGVVINGTEYLCPTWKPWSEFTNTNPGKIARSWEFTGGWETSTYNVPVGKTMYEVPAFEIGLGSRYAVCLAKSGSPFPHADICVVDRAKGTTRSVVFNGIPFAGPLVRGNTAIFYGAVGIDATYDTPPQRVILDLTTMTMRTEEGRLDLRMKAGTYAPSYMTDVPRLCTVYTGGSGGGAVSLLMDNDIIPVSGEHIEYSGNNIILRPFFAPGRGFQADGIDGGGYVEVAAWSPDSNLAGGDGTLKGYFP